MFYFTNPNTKYKCKKKEAQEILLNSSEPCILYERPYKIVCNPRGAGVYELSLKPIFDEKNK